MPTPNLPHKERPWKNVCITMPVELHEELIEVARQRDMPVSALVREVLLESQIRVRRVKAHGWFAQ